MKCLRAIAILDSLLRGALVAKPKELGELIGAGLIVELDPWILSNLDSLQRLWTEHAGEQATQPNGFWNPVWLETALAALENKLRSDFHRAVTSDEKLALQDQERAAMRRGLGLLRDPELRAQAQRNAQVKATQLQANRPLVPCPPDPSPFYGISSPGELVLSQLAARQQKYGSSELSVFLKSFQKAQAKMQQLAEQVKALDSGLGPVRKGKHQVVAGLIKSGLPVQQAVYAFQQAQQQVRRPDAHPAEPAHLAVTLVRHATETHNPAVAQQRMQQAELALLQKRVPPGPQTRGAAKSLLGFQDLNAAAARFVDLCGWFRAILGNDSNIMRYASRLMPVPGNPRELVQRCQFVGQRLAASSYSAQGAYGPPQGRIDSAAVALAALAPEEKAVDAIVMRFVQIRNLLAQKQVGRTPADIINPALELTACPGSPEEAVATAWTLALQLTGGYQPSLDKLELACSLAKRVVF